jgi:undecaprenyl-diphosphatase
LNYYSINFNYTLFKKINLDWSNSAFDVLMPVLRESIVWVPLYLFLAVFAYQNFGKVGIYWMLGAIATVCISDLVSSGFVKNYFNAPRPCRDSFYDYTVNLLINRCPGSGSFTSSHATNHFAFAGFTFFTLGHVVKWTRWLFLWAFSICYAQVYVGVHYPIDVVGGTLLGITIAMFTSNLFNSLIRTLVQPKSKS